MIRISRILIPGLITTVLFSGCHDNQGSISLSGTWEFKIDPGDRGISEAWYRESLEDVIDLPGSMAENGKGDDVRLNMTWTGSIYDSSWYFRPEMSRFREPDNLKFPMWLTPVKYYVGAAWYRKEIIIPPHWEGKRVVLFLERVHSESMLWVDDTEAGSQNSLAAPHVYDLTRLLTPGVHTLSLRIDNRIKDVKVGPDSHSITDHTQGNWNGVIGRMELQCMPPAWLDEIQVYPEPERTSARVRIRFRNETEQPVNGHIRLTVKSYNTDRKHRTGLQKHAISSSRKDQWFEFDIDMGKDFIPWDEFNPALYRLKVEFLSTREYGQKQIIDFGMRSVRTEGTGFILNGRNVFLRGNVDCAAFPITGYPPMDTDTWEDLFTKLKKYGLNHVRYHSWCPPEAAFKAADLTGIYLQPEGPSWPNHGVSLGDGLPVDQYLYDETRRMERWYGNHASWIMLASGNEPAGRNQVRYLGEFVEFWKERDPRRVYTGASVGSRWPEVPQAQFIVRSRPRGLPWENPPHTLFDHRIIIQRENVPYVSHEIGQFCAFPDFREIGEYTGVMKAKNFELFREVLEENDMGELASDFLMASGKLQLLCYKHEIEAALRTPGFGGFQLLSLNDFPGQGTALVGVLNSMYKEKGYAGAEEFSRFCSATVPLARIPKFVFTSDETFSAALEVYHAGPAPLRNTSLRYRITNTEDSTLYEEENTVEYIPAEGPFPLNEIRFPLSGVAGPEKLNLELSLDQTDAVNDWDFWVYPEKLPEPDTSDILICSSFDRNATERLEEGGKVLLLASGKVEKGKEVSMYFRPVFWNTSWFQMRPPHVTGIYCDPGHPVFMDFPTSFHTDLHWWEIQHRQQVMILDEFPDGFQPLIQPIDTWFLNRKLGCLFEATVLNGKIIVCSIDLKSDLDERPVARQLLYSILNYMNDQAFTPSTSLDPGVIIDLFRKDDGPAYDDYTKSSTEDLVPVTN
jgi:hypothetical protein